MSGFGYGRTCTFCDLPYAHLGVCARRSTPAERDVKQAAKQAPYAAGEFTPYEGVQRPRFGPVLMGIIKSPVGAMWGLALLVLLWLSGCA